MDKIPTKHKEKIKQIVEVNKDNPIWRGVDWGYLIKIYYTYVKLPSRFESVKDAVNRSMSCSGCKSQVREYFRTHSQNW